MTKKLFGRACQNPACRQMFGIEKGQDEATCPHCKTVHRIRWVPELEEKHKRQSISREWVQNPN